LFGLFCRPITERDKMKTTCKELLALARKGRPEVRYAAHRKGHSIAAWVKAMGRFVIVASLAIDGEWYLMPYEILVNGECCHKPGDWLEEAEPCPA
jgi:hypothetical protein